MGVACYRVGVNLGVDAKVLSLRHVALELVAFGLLERQMRLPVEQDC